MHNPFEKRLKWLYYRRNVSNEKKNKKHPISTANAWYIRWLFACCFFLSPKSCQEQTERILWSRSEKCVIFLRFYGLIFYVCKTPHLKTIETETNFYYLSKRCTKSDIINYIFSMHREREWRHTHTPTITTKCYYFSFGISSSYLFFFSSLWLFYFLFCFAILFSDSVGCCQYNMPLQILIAVLLGRVKWCLFISGFSRWYKHIFRTVILFLLSHYIYFFLFFVVVVVIIFVFHSFGLLSVYIFARVFVGLGLLYLFLW